MLLELGLVRHDVVIGACEVLLELVIKGLTRDLYADAENDMNVHDLLFQRRV